MESPRAGRFTATALMLGNLVTGCSVLAPAGMLPELSTGLGISIHAAGLLITFGAITLCIGSPLTAWLASRIERRTLLTTTLAVLALGNLAIGMVFAIYGVCGFLGVVVASRIVDTWGPYRTSLLFTCLLLAGVAGWALSAGTLVVMAIAVAIWGLGFASTNSMQQVRLVAAAPPLAPATVALNKSVLYIGQAIGFAVGGLLFAHELLHSVGFVAVGFVVLALVLVVVSRPRPAAVAPA